MKLRRYTQIIVPWTSIVIAISGLVWGMYEYENQKKQREIQRALKYVEHYEGSGFMKRDRRVNNIWLERTAEMKGESKPKSDGRTDIEDEWDRYIIEVIDREGMARDVQTLIGFYERIGICVQATICDRETAFRFFGPQVLAFHNMHYPYISKLRKKLENPQYAIQMEQFALDYHGYRVSNSE